MTQMNRNSPRRTSIAMLVMVLGLMMQPAAAVERPRWFPDEYRIAGGYGGFNRTWLFAGVFQMPAPGVLRAHRLELAAGFKTAGNDARPFVSLGPVWRLQMARRYFLEFGLSPTFLGGSTFEGRSIGGNFHFTSSAAIGRTLRRGRSVMLRIQHTSNASIRSRNPGLNMVGLSIQLQR